MYLYPQLPHQVAAHLVTSVRSRTIAECASTAELQRSETTFTATGGTRVAPETLHDLRSKVVAIAHLAGYPQIASIEQRLEFDMQAAVALHSSMQIAAAEAAKRGVWEFFTCVLLPDIVRWRFPGDSSGTAAERFFSGRRNTFQRLWWRAHLFRDSTRSDNPYALLALLQEDELVQIMERPSLAGLRELTAAVGSGLLEASATYSVPRREMIREVQKKIMRLGAFVCFEAIDRPSLDQCMRQLYGQVASAAEQARSASDG